MNLHEYQAKQLLAQYGVEVPGGQPCTTADEARSIAEKLFTEGHEMVVMKIQIHSGGRGKGVFKDGFKGGVHLCKTADDVHQKAMAMLGNTIVTKQTGEAAPRILYWWPVQKRLSPSFTLRSCSRYVPAANHGLK